MKISEFLIQNPTYQPSDLNYLRVNGGYDGKMLRGLHESIRETNDLPELQAVSRGL